ncbi:S8 family serine peptidase [Halalkalibacter urbisdiaboli]|uniref:S8 family serine peptidase n=1 Tax=Halalkalibacter urbisdiaboli TaxID=1960589 RepID=UPI001FDA7E3A|nr:S8 family serine peptidase [Halalkalibacter urbisdiaboli]
MKKIGLMFLVFVLVFTVIPFSGTTEASTNERVIVLFKENANKTLVSQAKGKIHREYKHVPALAITVPAAAIQGLKKNPNVIAVEPDQVVNVKGQTEDWGIPRTNAPSAWSSNFTGQGVKIAVVDTGIAKHDDLIIAGGAAFTSYTTSYHDDNGHGTHVAGIIGARNNSIGTVGIAPESSIYAVKALDNNGSGYLSDIVAGIDWSINNKMDIINLSLGTTSHSSTLQQIVDKAYSQNILVVAAAGNNGASDGSGDTVNYPARYESVIAVSATDSKDQRASFSATGSTVEVAAPGVNILSTYLNNQYGQMSGTSMATPYVAGNLALLKQANSTLSATDLRLKLQEGVVDLGSSGKDNWFGYGLIQAPTQGQEETSQETVIVEEPVQILGTATKVTTDQTSYVAGQTVNITVNVKDLDGSVLSGAEVTVAITPLSGKVITGTGTTDQNGNVTFTMTTKRTTKKGTYQVKADTTLNNYESSYDTTSFQIK